MELIVKSAVNDVKTAFLAMNESNKKAMEKLAAEIEAKGFVGDDEDRLELQKLRDKTLYEYMDTLVNTAKIELEARIKQIKASGGGGDEELMHTVSQIQTSVTELKDTTALKITEEKQQRITDVTVVSQEVEQRVEAVKNTFISRLNLLEKQVQEL